MSGLFDGDTTHYGNMGFQWPSLDQYVNIWELKGRVLVIAEKPKAAKKIAEALSSGFLVRKYNGIPYYEIIRGGLQLIIASAAGHLYELHTSVDGYPVFEYSWVPAYVVSEEKKYTKSYLDLLSSLFKKCQYYVNACDYDIEGSVIGYLLIKFHGDAGRALRAKFSSLMPQEIMASFSRLTPLDYNMIDAGLCRHELDWIWGINISRALMKALYLSARKKITLSAGRVQTPTLKYIVDYETERRIFVPLPQYNVSVVLRKGDQSFLAEYSANPVISESEAKSIKKSLESAGYLVVKQYEVVSQSISPPPPFNLGDLQEEAARIYGFSPMKTQSIAERLYLDALISYPRTNSQKLPPTLNYREILSKLAKITTYSGLISRLLSETRGVLRPREGEKEDPAHPAIYPTGVLPQRLTRDQTAIYDLIVRRFLAAFASPARVLHVKVMLVTPDGLFTFRSKGLTVEYLGWMVYYPFHKPSSKFLPALRVGDRLEVKKVIIRETYSKPAPRLKKIDILRWMEGAGLGTESTRAIIIEKLFERGYLKTTKTGIDVSELGVGVVEVIKKFFPDLASVELTRTFEVLMNDIMRGIRRRKEVLEEAKKVIKDLLSKFDSCINDVGLLLARKLSLIDNYEKCSIPGCRGESYKLGLCKNHYLAYEAVLKGYEEWKARKDVPFSDYVHKIARMKSTGKYVKDVLQHYILRKEVRKT